MIVAGSASPLLLSSAGGYNLTKSLRFRSSATGYLNRTPASAGNRKTWTWSGWVKRGTLGTNQSLFTCYFANNDTSYLTISFTSDNLNIGLWNTSILYTSAVYRDPSAWYHIVLAIDTTQATASNRAKLYVNGVQVTAFGSTGYPTQNTDLAVNSAAAHYISTYDGTNYKFDGYMAEINFIDGQALTPSSFGQTSSTTGVWQPIKYTGTYGTNGFYLPFTDVATTSGSNAGLGKDFSGNGNYWTTNNISVTTGTTYDSMSDVPTLTSATAANYCTLNPLDRNTNLAISNGNLTAIPSSTADYWLCRATMQLPSTGKWYWELTLNNTPYLYNAGIYSANRPLVADVSSTGNEYQVSWGTYTTYIKYQSNGAAFANWGTNTNPTSGNVLMFAVDSDNGTMWVGRNGTWYNTSGTANPATNTDPRFSSIPSGLFAGVNLPNPASDGVSMNFGQQGFAYTPPSGFKALNTFNLPTPTIGATASTVANKYMDATLYTGNGTSQSITNSGSMQPDFVWYKGRSTTYNHGLFDSIRGTLQRLSSNLTSAESTTAGSLTAFNSNGFSVGNDAGANQNTDTYVAWQWKANGSGSSNTAGSITSTVSANTTAGFSIVTFTGNATAGATVGHGLGVVPSFIIAKNRNNAFTDWPTYHISTGNNGGCTLNETAAKATATWWNNTTPSSTVVTLGSTTQANGSGNGIVLYCFAQVAGYSAFGSYTGNGSSDGTFVYTGFRPRFLMYKRTDTSGSWVLIDAARGPYNVINPYLLAESSGAEDSANIILDFLSNGFKQRNTFGASNASGGTYIYMAFAESPFKYANAR